MHYKKRNRLISVIVLLITCSTGIYIILSNLNDNIVFFYPPSEIDKIKNNVAKVRVGGLVKNDSIKTNLDVITFTIIDNIKELDIIYKGLLPALFRPGQGIVAEGILNNDGIFIASKLLAKHDENYMPPTYNQQTANKEK
ncbi:MAG: cytochrome c maturation protein CcmE [Rickettsiales bacterium]|nr:MAG: cytochrome c maturation protein CcmE [Rickettsiales bacterium]